MKSQSEQTDQTETTAAESLKLQIPRGQLRLSIACLLMAVFLAAFNQTVVVTALPTIVAEFGGFDRYAWVVTSYMVASTVVMPISSRLGSVYGRRKIFICAIALFCIGSFLVSVSNSMTQLIVYRAVHGLSAGAIMVTSSVTLAELLSKKKRARMQGLYGIVLVLAVILGPILGGLITEMLSWNWVFIFNILLALPILILVIWQFPKIAAEDKDHGLDVMGSVALVLCATPVLFALTMGGVYYSWDSWPIIASIILGIVMLALFIFVENKVEFPIMPLALYRDKLIKSSVIVVACANAVLYGVLLYVPLFLTAVQGASATGSGTSLIAVMLGIVSGVTTAGQIIGRTKKGHYRLLASGGAGITVVGMYLLSTLTGATSLFLILLYNGVLGYGIGAVISTITLLVQNSMPTNLLSIATSVLHFFRNLGGVAGTVALGIVMSVGFNFHLNQVMPEQLKSLLPSKWEQLINDNWQVLLERTELNAVFGSLPTFQIESKPQLIQTLRDSISVSLILSLQGVFLFGAVLAAISLVVVLFLKIPDDVRQDQSHL